ncbi:hypothetical protein OWR28_18815 [Chryseobacterium sp. 1B4]
MKRSALGVGALFFLGQAISAQKVNNDTLVKETKIDEVVLIGYGTQKKKKLQVLCHL